ncbi:MAG: XRE family transcriptional regulator [Panacagrimonas sp.]
MSRSYLNGQAQRLKALRKRLGKTQAEMAGLLHISTKGYQYYERGERDIPVVTLHRGKAHFALNPDWVLDGVGEMFLPEAHPERERIQSALRAAQTAVESPHIPEGDLIALPLLDVRASAGGGAVQDEHPELRSMMKFSETWLRAALHVKPQDAQLIVVQGTSMEPDLRPGDVLIVDSGENTVRRDALYVFETEDGMFVKTLQRLPGRGIRVISKNPDFETYTLTAGQAALIRVVGRVVFHGKLV